MLALQKETLGEIFINDLRLAKKSKGSLFSLLYDTLQNENPSEEEIMRNISELKDVNEALIYDSSLARFHIEQNGRNIRKTVADISGLKVIGTDNFKYKMLMIKKLNVLTSIRPDIITYLNLSGEAFIRYGYGNAKKFKKDFGNYINNLHQVSNTLYIDAMVAAY